jgi:hypothetical protein
VTIQDNWVADTLAKIGDESTIALLQKIASQTQIICGTPDIDPLGPKHLDDLTARIRSRLAAD